MPPPWRIEPFDRKRHERSSFDCGHGQLNEWAVEVHAIDDGARQFYLKHVFVSLVDDPNHLFLSMRFIRKMDLPPWTGELPPVE